MNIEPILQSLSKSELERMCRAHLRMLPQSQHVERVEIVGCRGSRRNWIVAGIEPALSTDADNAARNALSELQTQFRLAE